MDVILGIQWIETLGKCEVDWKEQIMSFIYIGNKVPLYGDITLHCTKFSFKSLSPVYTRSKPRREGLLTKLLTILEEFSDGFAIPTTLSPMQGKNMIFPYSQEYQWCQYRHTDIHMLVRLL